MQSMLQYRKFRRNLQQQIDRHGLESVAAISRASEPGSSLGVGLRETGNQTVSRSHTGNQKDNEKDDQSDTSTVAPQARTTTPHTHKALDKPVDSDNIATFDSALQSGLVEESTGEKRSTNLERDSHSSTRESSVPAGYETADDDDNNATRMRSAGTRLGQMMTGVSVRSKDAKHYFVVGFQGDDDPLNPHNWSQTKRIACTLALAMIGLIVGVASSIDSAAIPQSSMEFGVSEVVGSLATGLYLVGFGFGAFTAGPISETVGRNPVYLVTGVLFMIFVMASGLAPNIGAQLVFRFLAGFFGSTPLTCAGGSISDMWNAVERTATFPVFANAAFLGPILGPVIGGWIAQEIDWRWCEWVTLIWAGLIFGSAFLFMPETYAPTLLKWKAEHLRELTGDERYKAELEVAEVTFWDKMLHNLYRPWLLLFFEPIAMLFTLYLTVVYIVLFTFLTGYEFIFERTYGLSQGVTFTIFTALAVGLFGASALVPFVVKTYNRKLQAAKDQGQSSLPPEQRLLFAMIGAPLLPLGIFWMAWTSYASVSVWSPIMSNLLVGFAILTIFISTYQYLIDCYEQFAASALVGVTFVRYLAAGGMIPVSIPFYRNLGVHWTLTILGAISAIMAPVPYLFYYYGAKIRSKSRYAVGKA